MAEQTLETQLQESVAKYVESGNQIDKFTNGGDIEIVNTAQGPKPTLSKIVKDSQDMINASMTDLAIKADQVATDRVAVETLKSEIKSLKDDFEIAHIPGINSQLAQHTTDISVNTLKGQETVLWESLTGQQSGVITLNADFSKFKWLYFDFAVAIGAEFHGGVSMLVSKCPINIKRNIAVITSNWVTFTPTSTTQFTLQGYGQSKLYGITGVK